MGGDSGGPLLNLDGEVIAINSSVNLDIEKNLYIPSERFVENWKHISLSIDQTRSNAVAEKGSKTQDDKTKDYGYLGVATETDAGFLRIRRVNRDSPAEKSGMLAEDVITAINEKKIKNFEELVSQLKQHLPQSVVIVRVLRSGQILEFPVTLGSSRNK
jgi:serine protease Do